MRNYRKISIVQMSMVCLLVVLKSTRATLSDNSPLATRTEAVEKCLEADGKLFSFDDFKSKITTLSYHDGLKFGESVWLSDHIKFSPFIKLEGCFHVNIHYNSIQKNGTNSLHHCISSCLQNLEILPYIGINLIFCFCLNITRTELGQRQVSNSYCTAACDYNALDVCGSQERAYMSVYKIFSDSELMFPSDHNLTGSCVYVKIISTSKYELYTASCYEENNVNVDGYYCMGNLKNLDSVDCVFKHSSDSYCFMREAVSRSEAEDKCLRKNGVLADHTQMLQIALKPKHFKYNLTYWTRTYRTFEISHEFSFDNLICVALFKTKKLQFDEQNDAWKEHGVFTLTPDDCSRKKTYFCAFDSSNSSRGDTVSTTSPVSSVSKATKFKPLYKFTNSLNTTGLLNLSGSVGGEPYASEFVHERSKYHSGTENESIDNQTHTNDKTNTNHVDNSLIPWLYVSLSIHFITIILVTLIVITLYRLRKSFVTLSNSVVSALPSSTLDTYKSNEPFRISNYLHPMQEINVLNNPGTNADDADSSINGSNESNNEPEHVYMDPKNCVAISSNVYECFLSDNSKHNYESLSN